MEKQELIALLQSTYLFKGLSAEYLEEILSISKIITLPKDTYVVREGEISNEIYLLFKGEVEVVKKDEKTGHFHRLAILGGIELIGEMTLLDQSPRSASVITTEDSELLVIPNLPELGAFQVSHSQIMRNISTQLTKRLRSTDEVTVKALESELQGAQIRIEMGNFLFRILVVLAVWIFCINLINHSSAIQLATAIITFPMLFALLLVSIIHVKTSIYPIHFYGLNLDHWKKNAWEGVLFSLPVLLGMVIVKIALVRYSPLFQNNPVIHFNLIDPTSLLSPAVQISITVGYVLLVPVQEFVSRGTIQSSLYSFLGKQSHFWSIVISCLLFAAFHAQVTFLFAMVAFIGGCLWGWLYARQGSLVGAIVSHALIGLTVLGFLGFEKLFDTL